MFPQANATCSTKNSKTITTAPTTVNNNKRKRTTGSGCDMMNLHWTPLSTKNFENSVFSTMSSDEPSKTVGGDDIQALEELFHKKKKPVAKKIDEENECPESNRKKQKRVSANIIDLTRANNIAISLKAFKDLSFEEIANTISTLDPSSKITGDRISFLLTLLPTDQESSSINAYKGEEQNLAPAELFFYKLKDIKRLKQKVKSMQTVDTFDGCTEDLMKKFSTLRDACNEVVGSKKLKKLLETILAIGNIMNEGSQKGGAVGFTFDSLLKLTQTKSVDGKTSILDYIVKTFATKNQLEDLDLPSDLPSIFNASRLSIVECVNDVRKLKTSITAFKAEIKKMKGDIIEQKKGEVPKKKAVQVDVSMKVPETQSADPMSSLLAAVRSKGGTRQPLVSGMAGKSDDCNESGSGQGNIEVNIYEDESMQRVNSFLKSSGDKYSALEQVRDESLVTSKKLVAYFGEEGENDKVIALLTTLVKFIGAIGEALKKFGDEKERKERQERIRLKKEQMEKEKEKRGKKKAESKGAVKVEEVKEEAEKDEKHTLVSALNKRAEDSQKESKPTVVYKSKMTANGTPSKFKIRR